LIRMPKQKRTILDWALYYHQLGWCIVPFPYGTKRAGMKWKKYQNERPSQDQLSRWFKGAKQQNIAVVLGEVSGGLTCRDFDTMRGYKEWASKHPDLAKVLPTAQTGQGMHVYFEGHVESFTDITGANGKHLGELRGSRCCCVLPPSVHPNGSTYKWVVPLDKGKLIWFEPEQIELIFRNMGNSHVTERTERTEEDRRDKGKKCKQLKKNAKIEKAIVDTLPTEFRTRHRRIFDFARLLKSTPEYTDAAPEQFKVIIREWHKRALLKIRTKEFEETWIDFLMGWPKVKYKVGEGPIDQIFARAKRSKPSKVALEKYPTHEKLQLLTALCRELQIIAGNKPFFLSARTAGKLFNVTAMTASCWLRLLVYDDILRVVRKGGTREMVRKATRYKYIRSLKNWMFGSWDNRDG